MFPLSPANLVALVLFAATPASGDLVAEAKGVKLGSSEAAVRSQLASIGAPREPSYSRCGLGGCEDAAADSPTRMGLIWNRGGGNPVSMLYVGFCRRSGEWLAEDVTTYEPGLMRKLTGRGDWKETFEARARGVCDVPLVERYVEVAKALALGASPESAERTTVTLGQPDGVAFSSCTKSGCIPATEREASMMTIRWGREREGVQAELTLIFCGALGNWELSSIHVASRRSAAGAFGTERSVTEMFRQPNAKKPLGRCLERL